MPPATMGMRLLICNGWMAVTFAAILPSVLLLLNCPRVIMAEESGRIELLLDFYSNPGFELSDGSNCDICAFGCSSCDTFMSFCLDSMEAEHAGMCTFGRFETPILGTDATIVFGLYGEQLTPETPGLTNPLTFLFDGNWKGGISAIVEILEYDAFSANDLINRADFFISGPAGQSNQTTAWSQPITRPMHSRSFLTLQYRVYCREGVQCNEPSVPESQSDNATVLNGSSVVRELGDTFNMRCATPSNQPVEWRDRRGTIITQISTSRRRADANGWLNITSVEPSDRGRYTCHELTTGSMIALLTLVIEGPPQDVQISVLSDPTGEMISRLVVSTDESVTLVCSSAAYPGPLLSWIQNGRILTTLEQEVRMVEELEEEALQVSRRSLLVVASGNNTLGNFTCVADNGKGPRALATAILSRQHVAMETEVPTAHTTTVIVSSMPVSSTAAMTTSTAHSTSNTVAVNGFVSSSPPRTTGASHTTSTVDGGEQNPGELNDDSSSSSSVTVAVGAAVAGVLLLAVIIITLLIVSRRKSRRRKKVPLKTANSATAFIVENDGTSPASSFVNPGYPSTATPSAPPLEHPFSSMSGSGPRFVEKGSIKSTSSVLYGKGSMKQASGRQADNIIYNSKSTGAAAFAAPASAGGNSPGKCDDGADGYGDDDDETYATISEKRKEEEDATANLYQSMDE
ncbi:mucin-5AC-like [Sycon ciliatum]|uniref:mucin-5AC-like n=1 Tax=Sycon ciliatum TaxID=27933 RepID=UPI0031F667F6